MVGHRDLQAGRRPLSLLENIESIKIQITGPDTASGIWAMEDLLALPAGNWTPGA
ncbi:hypothetical protein ACFVYG_40665 [Streptomyces sp. NPDC058256]|uniref:hypothetical protein n=1 Tax=Streptomyces sp. NPDC058256 TaxID=3346408 RepID=UPI0036E2534B